MKSIIHDSDMNLDRKMRMEMNMLNYTTEVLSIEYKDGKWRSVAYLSKLLNKTECNYEMHNRKMLVVIRGLKA